MARPAKTWEGRENWFSNRLANWDRLETALGRPKSMDSNPPCHLAKKVL